MNEDKAIATQQQRAELLALTIGHPEVTPRDILESLASTGFVLRKGRNNVAQLAYEKNVKGS